MIELNPETIKKISDYYNRKDVQEELLRIGKGREIQIWMGEVRGRRPEIVYMLGDIKDLVKQGMTSFHISEERWQDALRLEPGMQKKQLDSLRAGWDMILDLDCKDLEYSQMAAELLIDAIKFHNIDNFSVKFSGNHGFHIAVPFEAFPDEVNGVNIKDYFPDGIRVISEYLKDMTREFLSERMLKNENVSQIAVRVGKTEKDLFVKDKNGGDKFDPYEVVDVDSVLISSRHLFRAPYSLNEKSGLVSIPISDIKKFDKEQAKIENVKVELKFLDTSKIAKGEARQLLVQAFDWAVRNKKQEFVKIETYKREYALPKDVISADFFPPCMLKMMSGIKEDGKKRALFLMIAFLKNMSWSFDKIEEFLIEWNKKNGEPLRENYIAGQMSWARKNNSKILPPNCDNASYYKGINVCFPDELCRIIKNPVQYSMRKANLMKKLEEETAKEAEKNRKKIKSENIKAKKTEKAKAENAKKIKEG